MDPAVGASTWAFGSQRWREYMGIFTKKARMQRAHQRLWLILMGALCIKKNIFSCVDSFIRSRILNRRGKLAETVYIII